MDSARWEKIQTLFHDAVQHPELERQAFLETACAGDRELIAEVQAMLTADKQRASLLDRGLPDVAYQMVGASLDSISSREFGPYRLTRLLGEGGMGVVWLAEREDTGNQVAIKFLPHAGLSPARRERFAREIKTLAKLKHPFIARLYDAGSLSDGTPWFVMEFVEGLRFTEYCDQQGLGIEDRLRLFHSVCEAVQYAHGQEIIHRDLKPSNILVGPDGTPRLLDFGIARQLQNHDEPGDRTQPGLRFMSRDYSAPEWVRDGSVGFYTDVYSLGVILYEILAGRPPFDRSEPVSQLAENTTAGHDPDKPSLFSANVSLSKAAWNDLDVLCLKAMHKDAQERYRSVEALIRDLDHYLKGEPLEARPDTIRYRLGKFVTRNRTAVLATSLALALSVGLAVFFTVRLAKARNTALAEAARAQSVEQFMVNLFEGGDEEAGPPDDLRVVTLLDRGLKQAQALDSDPAAQAELYQTLGSVYQSLGKIEQADHLLQLALERRRVVFGSDQPEVAEGLLYLASLRGDQAQLGEAQRLIEQALAINRRHLAADDPAVARTMTALGGVLERRGAYDKAIDVLTEALRIQTEEGERATKTDRLASVSLLANAHYHLGNYALSETLNQQALAIDRRLRGEHHPDVADDFMNLGNIQFQLGHYPEAEQYHRQALEIYRSWYGLDNPNTADITNYVAKDLVSEGRYDEAEVLLKHALAIFQQAYGKDPHPRVAVAIGQLGTIALQRGKLDEAEADYTRAIEIDRAVYGDQHQFTASAWSSLADVYIERGEYARAESLLRDVIQRLAQLHLAGHLTTGVARLKLGRTLVREKRYQEAEGELLAGYKILMKQTSPTVSWLQKARQDLVTIYDASNQPDKASEFRAELAANSLPQLANGK